MESYKYGKWHESVRVFLYQFFLRVYPNDSFRKEKIIIPLLTEECMYTWGKVFTTEDFDENYNYLEYLSYKDKLLKLVFLEYLLKKYPNLSQSEYSNLDTSYISTDTEAVISAKLDFKKYIRIDGDWEIPDEILSNILKAFLEAVRYLSDKYLLKGIGMTVYYDIVEYIFENIIQVDLEKAEGPSKTQVKQIFKRFNLQEPEELTSENKDKTWTTIIKLTSQQANFLLKNNIELKTKVLSKVTMIDRKASIKESYEVALKNLKDIGVSTKWSKDIKDKIYFSRVNRKLFEEALKKASEEGFYKFRVETPSKHSKVNIGNMILKGVREDGSMKTLLQLSFNKNRDNFEEVKEKLLYNYLLE